jgi:hypothetical protein
MTRAVLLLFLAASCSPIQKFSDQIEEEHDILYKQKALFVTAVDSRRVWFTNPTHTRCYFLRGKQYTRQWDKGDTLLLEFNPEALYRLNFAKACN